MMVDAAHRLGIECVVLARPDDESVTATTAIRVIRAEHVDVPALMSLAGEVDVITFDHEPVDLAAVAEAAGRGAVFRPGPTALGFSDKAHQRATLTAAGLPLPAFVVATDSPSVDRFGREHGWPIVVKAPIGGYDGRGVTVAGDLEGAVDEMDRYGGRALLEPLLPLRAELSVVTVRGTDGEVVAYPPFDTRQVDGICREVSAPSTLPRSILARAESVAVRVASFVGSVGVLAVELFVVGDDVLVNEVAPRPHNSGHLTIEACATSQFENHLRAVAGLPLGPTTLTVPSAAMVNVVGGPSGTPTLTGGRGVTIHDYGKSYRAGRKLGHVTAVADDVTAALTSARTAVG